MSTTTIPQRAALYCRISDDRTGERAGVQRQEEDCRQLAERKGWPVHRVYTDNDLSAWGGKLRPEYGCLLDDIKNGVVDAVVVWHQDRLHRRPKELEEFFEVCDSGGLRHMASVTGDVDLGTDDGRFHLRILGAVSRKESDDKSRRIRRKMAELAKAGKGKGGGTRPFGFEPDRVTIDKGEAKLIREAARRVLAGESLRGIATDWNDRCHRTVTGTPWKSTVLRRILTAPRTAGLRQHEGVVVADAEWPAIIDQSTHQRLNVILGDAKRLKNEGATARRYLLTGLAHCELCGEKLVARPKDGARSYVCAGGTNFSGCGGIRCKAEPLEALIFAAVIVALDSDEFDRALRHSGDVDQSELFDSLRDDEAGLEQLARDHYADKIISRAEFLAARNAIEGRMEATRRKLASLEGGRALTHVPSNSEALRSAWQDKGLDWQRALLRAVLDKVMVGPAVRGRNRFDPDRVSLVWRA